MISLFVVSANAHNLCLTKRYQWDLLDENPAPLDEIRTFDPKTAVPVMDVMMPIMHLINEELGELEARQSFSEKWKDYDRRDTQYLRADYERRTLVQLRREMREKLCTGRFNGEIADLFIGGSYCVVSFQSMMAGLFPNECGEGAQVIMDSFNRPYGLLSGSCYKPCI